MKPKLVITVIALSALTVGVLAQQGARPIDRTVLPSPPPKFAGTINEALKDSGREQEAPPWRPR